MRFDQLLWDRMGGGRGVKEAWCCYMMMSWCLHVLSCKHTTSDQPLHCSQHRDHRTAPSSYYSLYHIHSLQSHHLESYGLIVVSTQELQQSDAPADTITPACNYSPLHLTKCCSELVLRSRWLHSEQEGRNIWQQVLFSCPTWFKIRVMSAVLCPCGQTLVGSSCMFWSLTSLRFNAQLLKLDANTQNFLLSFKAARCIRNRVC